MSAPFSSATSDEPNTPDGLDKPLQNRFEREPSGFRPMNFGAQKNSLLASALMGRSGGSEQPKLSGSVGYIDVSTPQVFRSRKALEISPYTKPPAGSEKMFDIAPFGGSTTEPKVQATSAPTSANDSHEHSRIPIFESSSSVAVAAARFDRCDFDRSRDLSVHDVSYADGNDGEMSAIMFSEAPTPVHPSQNTPQFRPSSLITPTQSVLPIMAAKFAAAGATSAASPVLENSTPSARAQTPQSGKSSLPIPSRLPVMSQSKRADISFGSSLPAADTSFGGRASPGRSETVYGSPLPPSSTEGFGFRSSPIRSAGTVSDTLAWLSSNMGDEIGKPPISEKPPVVKTISQDALNRGIFCSGPADRAKVEAALSRVDKDLVGHTHGILEVSENRESDNGKSAGEGVGTLGGADDDGMHSNSIEFHAAPPHPPPSRVYRRASLNRPPPQRERDATPSKMLKELSRCSPPALPPGHVLFGDRPGDLPHKTDPNDPFSVVRLAPETVENPVSEQTEPKKAEVPSPLFSRKSGGRPNFTGSGESLLATMELLASGSHQPVISSGFSKPVHSTLITSKVMETKERSSNSLASELRVAEGRQVNAGIGSGSFNFSSANFFASSTVITKESPVRSKHADNVTEPTSTVDLVSESAMDIMEESIRLEESSQEEDLFGDIDVANVFDGPKATEELKDTGAAKGSSLEAIKRLDEDVKAADDVADEIKEEGAVETNFVGPSVGFDVEERNAMANAENVQPEKQEHTHLISLLQSFEIAYQKSSSTNDHIADHALDELAHVLEQDSVELFPVMTNQTNTVDLAEALADDQAMKSFDIGHKTGGQDDGLIASLIDALEGDRIEAGKLIEEIDESLKGAIENEHVGVMEDEYVGKKDVVGEAESTHVKVFETKEPGRSVGSRLLSLLFGSTLGGQPSRVGVEEKKAEVESSESETSESEKSPSPVAMEATVRASLEEASATEKDTNVDIAFCAEQAGGISVGEVIEGRLAVGDLNESSQDDEADAGFQGNSSGLVVPEQKDDSGVTAEMEHRFQDISSIAGGEPDELVIDHPTHLDIADVAIRPLLSVASASPIHALGRSVTFDVNTNESVGGIQVGRVIRFEDEIEEKEEEKEGEKGGMEAEVVPSDRFLENEGVEASRSEPNVQADEMEFETAADDEMDEVGGTSSNVSEDLIAEAVRTYDEDGQEPMVARAAEADLIQPTHVSPKPTERVTPVRSAASKSPKRAGSGASRTPSSQQQQRRTPTAPPGSSETRVSPSVRASSVSKRNVSKSRESPELKTKGSPGSAKREVETRALTSPGGRAPVRSIRTPQKHDAEIEKTKVQTPPKQELETTSERSERVVRKTQVVVHELDEVGLLPVLTALQDALSQSPEEGGYITKLLGSGGARHSEEGKGDVSVLSTFSANEVDEQSYIAMHGVLRDVKGPVKALGAVTEKLGALVDAEAMQIEGLGEVQERVEVVEKKQRDLYMQQQALENGIEELGEKLESQGYEQHELRKAIEGHEREQMEAELVYEQEVASTVGMPVRTKGGIGMWSVGMILGMVIVLVVWAMLTSGAVPRYSRGGMYGFGGHGILVGDIEDLLVRIPV
ncbi:hypothetical protein BJ742DRAFT_796083 [Cladochytrium replicatum]|nr:hypothetical protein BJ742DRAFT_796083 [Cladochytrium replicatum]